MTVRVVVFVLVFASVLAFLEGPGKLLFERRQLSTFRLALLLLLDLTVLVRSLSAVGASSSLSSTLMTSTPAPAPGPGAAPGNSLGFGGRL